MAQSTVGTELMRQIHDGKVDHLPSETLAKTRDEISSSIEKLLDVGARIRPLLMDGKQIGWVRGVHLTERKALKRWVYNELDFVMHILRAGTTLSPETIDDLNLVELRSLCRVVQEKSSLSERAGTGRGFRFSTESFPGNRCLRRY